MSVELIADVRRQNSEGPHWDPRTGLLYFVAIPEGEVHRLNPETGAHKIYSLGRPCGAVVTTNTPGKLLVALMDGLFFLDEETEGLTAIAQPEAHLPGNRFNDAKCDNSGRLYAGTMSHDENLKKLGSLYRLDTDGSIHTMETGVSVSNGLDFSPDNRTMYYIDSPTGTVDAFDYDAATGALTNRRTVARIPDGMGVPDGMTVDSNGELWVALWGGWCVMHFAPDGKEISRIEVPARLVSSCAFGGPDMKTLYITTAGGGGKTDPEQPHAGSVFRIQPGATGQKCTRFDDSKLG